MADGVRPKIATIGNRSIDIAVPAYVGGISRQICLMVMVMGW